MTDTLPVLGHFALTLFDSGSSQLFYIVDICNTCMFRSGTPRLCFISVYTIWGNYVVNEKIKACQIEIASRVLDVTLLVLDMHDFDVILGLDWLAVNHASIDFSRNEVVFSPPTKPSFKFKRVRTVVLPKVITTMKVSKLLN